MLNGTQMENFIWYSSQRQTISGLLVAGKADVVVVVVVAVDVKQKGDELVNFFSCFRIRAESPS